MDIISYYNYELRKQHANIGALIIRMGLWGPLCCNYNNEPRPPPQKKKKKKMVLVTIKTPTACYKLLQYDRKTSIVE